MASKIYGDSHGLNGALQAIAVRISTWPSLYCAQRFEEKNITETISNWSTGVCTVVSGTHEVTLTLVQA